MQKAAGAGVSRRRGDTPAAGIMPAAGFVYTMPSRRTDTVRRPNASAAAFFAYICRRPKKGTGMKYTCALLSVADINAARRFYEELFGLQLDLDYGKNIVFTCGLALQQDFDRARRGFREKRSSRKPATRRSSLKKNTLTIFWKSLKASRILHIWAAWSNIVGDSASSASTTRTAI